MGGERRDENGVYHHFESGNLLDASDEVDTSEEDEQAARCMRRAVRRPEEGNEIAETRRRTALNKRRTLGRRTTVVEKYLRLRLCRKFDQNGLRLNAESLVAVFAFMTPT